MSTRTACPLCEVRRQRHGRDPGATDEETALAGIAAMEEFYHRIGMPVNFKELGIDPTDEQMAEMAASCARACGGAKRFPPGAAPERYGSYL